MKFSPAAVLTMYAAFLAAGALFALLLIGFGEAVSLGIMSALSFAAAYASRGAPKKGDAGYKLYMIGVHIGLILQLTFTGVFAVQSYRSYGVPEKADRHYLFVLMAAGSAAALYGMMKFKPKKEKK